jgi:hypothetical protein
MLPHGSAILLQSSGAHSVGHVLFVARLVLQFFGKYSEFEVLDDAAVTELKKAHQINLANGRCGRRGHLTACKCATCHAHLCDVKRLKLWGQDLSSFEGWHLVESLPLKHPIERPLAVINLTQGAPTPAHVVDRIVVKVTDSLKKRSKNASSAINYHNRPSMAKRKRTRGSESTKKARSSVECAGSKRRKIDFSESESDFSRSSQVDVEESADSQSGPDVEEDNNDDEGDQDNDVDSDDANEVKDSEEIDNRDFEEEDKFDEED